MKSRYASLAVLLALTSSRLDAAAPPLAPVVEAEEQVYRYTDATNGAGPTWCHGSTCLVRNGDDVFASGIETLPDAKPLNNCRWLLFHRGSAGWEQVLADKTGRTREPSPLAIFPDGRLFLSANPTLAPGSYSGPARPEILEFKATQPQAPFKVLLPGWEGTPSFTEHSYRSFAADGPSRELILLQNIGYTHAEWAFLNREGQWSAHGQLKWPYGAEYEKPEPIRVCYPTVALQNRAVFFCGVSDIIEPNSQWRAYKKELTGREWDYDFRRLFLTWTPDITREPFRPWLEVSSREATCGWIMPLDLWVDPQGAVHILWTERALDERLRAKFFPTAKQSHALNYAIVQDGKIVHRRALVEAREGEPGETASAGRFQVTPDHRLFVFCYVNGTNKAGKSVSENRLMELLPEGKNSPPVTVAMKYPLTDFFTATIRGGSPPANTIDLLGARAGSSGSIHYARVRLW